MALLQWVYARLAPAEMGVGGPGAVIPLGKDAALDRLVELASLLLGTILFFVEALEEEQVGDLLDDFDGVGDAARPKAVPKLVDLVAYFSG